MLETEARPQSTRGNVARTVPTTMRCLGMDVQDLWERIEAWNIYLLFGVNNTIKLAFAYPFANKEAVGGAWKRLELTLTFVVLFSLHSNPGAEFLAKRVPPHDGST